jgi:hypothetical protein
VKNKKLAGIVLMLAFAGAFVDWTLRDQFALASTLGRMAVSGLLTLGIFVSWRFLVWNRPGKKL